MVKTNVDLVATTTGDVPATNAPADLTEVAFEGHFCRQVEIVFLSGCSLVGSVSIDILDRDRQGPALTLCIFCWRVTFIVENHGKCEMTRLGRDDRYASTLNQDSICTAFLVFGGISWPRIPCDRRQSSCGLSHRRAKRLDAGCHGRQ